MASQTMDREIAGVLETVGRVTGQGAAYTALSGGEPVCNGCVSAFCRTSMAHPVAGGYCQVAVRGATLQAVSSGEPNYQRCWAGLVFAVVPVAPRGRCRGGIAVGGAVFEDEADELAATVEARLRALRVQDTRPFLDRLARIPAISASALRGLGQFLLEATFSSGLNSPASVERQHRKYLQQRRIAEAVSELRQRAPSPPDLVADTYRLVGHLQDRNETRAQELISEYLARLLVAGNWNLPRLRAHVRVLLAVLSSQEVLDGQPWEAVMSREQRVMARLEAAGDPESICLELADAVTRRGLGPGSESWERGSLCDRVMNWLAHHLQGPATLAEAARAVGASPSAIAHRLPADTGKTYGQHRTAIRIAEAKRLLATTDMPLGEIASLCGFSDQSHFTRVFKREINLTPGRFRAMLDPTGARL